MTRQNWEKSTLKERIDFLREMKGVSQAAIGRAAGMADGSIARFVRRPRPSVKILKAIASAWDVSFDWLAWGVGPVENTRPHVDPDDVFASFPHLSEAVELLRDKVAPETLGRLAAIALETGVDLELAEWQIILLGLDRKLRSM